MATKPKSGAPIVPDYLYIIRFSKLITDGDGKKYIPRANQTVKVRGRVLETIKTQIDSYEAT